MVSHTRFFSAALLIFIFLTAFLNIKVVLAQSYDHTTDLTGIHDFTKSYEEFPVVRKTLSGTDITLYEYYLFQQPTPPPLPPPPLSHSERDTQYRDRRHFAILSSGLPSNTLRGTWEAADHRYERSQQEMWKDGHGSDASNTWTGRGRLSHFSRTSMTWPPGHTGPISRTWTPVNARYEGHHKALSLSWPANHRESTTGNWVRNGHNLEDSRSWPPNHLVNDTNTSTPSSPPKRLSNLKVKVIVTQKGKSLPYRQMKVSYKCSDKPVQQKTVVTDRYGKASIQFQKGKNCTIKALDVKSGAFAAKSQESPPAGGEAGGESEHTLHPFEGRLIDRIDEVLTTLQNRVDNSTNTQLVNWGTSLWSTERSMIRALITSIKTSMRNAISAGLNCDDPNTAFEGIFAEIDRIYRASPDGYYPDDIMQSLRPGFDALIAQGPNQETSIAWQICEQHRLKVAAEESNKEDQADAAINRIMQLFNIHIMRDLRGRIFDNP